MTPAVATPDVQPAGSGSPDVPLATNPYGKSEYTLLLVTVAGLLTDIFGKDWGIGKHAQAIGGLAFLLSPMVLALARVLKHQTVLHSNATVLVAQINAKADATTAAIQATPAAPAPVSGQTTGADPAAWDMTGVQDPPA